MLRPSGGSIRLTAWGNEMSDAQFEESGDLVYHYTDQSGLVGIIQRREIWATNVGYLNDISEVAHGVDYFAENRADVLKALIEKRPFDARYSERYRRIRVFHFGGRQEVSREGPKRIPLRIFVFRLQCFP